MSAYGFLRWLRSGASAAIARPRSAAGPGLRAGFTASLTVTDDLGQQVNPYRELTLYGPGDVIGVDGRQVLRFSPQPESLDGAYEQFAHVEFDDPALPWLFTPFHEEADGTLLPWLAVVVVAEREGVGLGYTPGALLPVLHVDDVTRELPNLAEAHAWAHVQITGGLPATADDFDTLLASRPELNLSRLICPRLLKPATRYLACVVPVFKAGALAGLGQAVTGVGAADLAYDHAKPCPVDLPVYLNWSFTTAAGAGFETLVRRLVARPADQLPGVGQRILGLGDPGFGALGVDDGQIGGALRIPGTTPADADTTLRRAIEEIVNQVDTLAPPIYGRWLAAASRVPAGTSWLRQLNIEPRHRAAAGLGAQVVQAEQEAMMAAAWEQLGDVLRANELLRHGQLALAVGAQLHARHLTPLTTYALLSVAGPALSRITSVEAGRTLYGVLAASCLPLITLHASFRKLTRPRGPLARRADAGREVPRGFDIEGLLTRLVNAGLPADPSRPSSPAATLDETLRDIVIDRLDTAGHTPLGVHRRAIAARLTLLRDRAAPAECTPPVGDPAVRALDRLRPAVTVPPRVRAQLALPPSILAIAATLEPILAAPRLDGAAYRSLTELGQDWLLPGLEHVPANTVTGVETDDEFIEAFMVGLNHEIGRELLWRGYPTDQRGTVMARFWELTLPRDDLTEPAEKPAQITKIHTWPAASALGTHRPIGGPGLGLVLLLRGDLVRQFPRPGIVLARAEWARADTGQLLHHPDGRPLRRPLPLAPDTTAVPLFTGRLEPDVLFLGFSVSAADAAGVQDDPNGDPGCFVMFTEQPTEPRFDLGATAGAIDAVTGRYGSWRDLARADVTTDAASHLDLALTTASARFQALIPSGAPNWDGRSDGLAAILLHRPFRLFVHASDLLPVTA